MLHELEQCIERELEYYELNILKPSHHHFKR